MAAIKPPMYSVGVVPVMVAAAAAYAETGSVAWGCVARLILGAVCVIAWLNLSNDGFDAATGVDRSKPESVVNLVGGSHAATLVLLLAHALLAAGAALLHCGLSGAGDARVGAMLAAAVACGYAYQGPPFRLSYKGLGEPLCFTAFGPLATVAFYLAVVPQALAATRDATSAVAAGAALPVPPPLVWLLSALVGITTSAILFCSHFHQIAGDRAAGKLSPLVRLGTERGCQVLKAATALPYALLAAGAAAGACPPLLLATSLLSLPPAAALLRYADDHHRVPSLIAPLKRYAIKWHIAFGLSIVLGLTAGRALA